MAELTTEDIKAIHETHDKVIVIETLLGNGIGGLLEDHKNLKKDYYDFKRQVLTVFAFMVGSGILGVGIYNFLLRG